MTSLSIDEVGETIVVSGTGARPAGGLLSGPRASVEARMSGGGKTWKARFPLVASRWGGPMLPLPSGDYALTIEGVDTEGLSLPSALLPGLRVTVAGGQVRISPPIPTEFTSEAGQAVLEHRYTAASSTLKDAVFFESFYGRSTGDNPRAIDREIADRMPHITRYWSVADRSVPVPEGAIAVVEGTPDWWEARGSARLLVVNDWLRRRFVRTPGQKVLQTWHGTPLKRLALHRPGFDLRRVGAVVKEARRWDVMLAQNPYGERVMRKAYAFFGKPIWTEGYPRNDILHSGTGSAVRDSLGISAEERVLLYAPTWRDDRAEMVDFVDPAALAQQADAVVLVRGHSRTIEPGRDARGPRVIDVTGFPETALLLLAADALITDYSSVMFDFSVTGKPMFFLVPDLEHFRGTLRGFYFDLVERAPGPLVRSQAELVEALGQKGLDDIYADRYAAWKRQFNRLDDGGAARRVVDRLIDQGMLG